MATFGNILLTNSILDNGTVGELLTNPKASTTFTGTRIVGADNVLVKTKRCEINSLKDQLKISKKVNKFKVFGDIKMIKDKVILIERDN